MVDRKEIKHGDEPADVRAEFPVGGFNGFGFGPDAAGPLLPFDLGQAAVAEVAGSDGNEVGGNRYRLMWSIDTHA